MEAFLGDKEKRLPGMAAGRPYLYLSMTPQGINTDDGMDTAANMVDTTGPGVVDLLRNPPNYREGGWGLYRVEPRTTPYGIVSEFDVSVLRDTQRLELLRNGHLELSLKIDEKRFDIEHVRRDGREVSALYLYPLCELPLNFLRLAKYIRQEYRTDGPVIITMRLYNVRGYSICAHARNTEGYKRQVSEGNFPLWASDHLKLSPVKVTGRLEPGVVAKELAGRLWEAFGFDDTPPLFDDHGRFRP
ncbi:MAG: hypothetical protein ACYSRP_10640 [Planctomycetota bacterium]|jgi:hypothetical protein